MYQQRDKLNSHYLATASFIYIYIIYYIYIYYTYIDIFYIYIYMIINLHFTSHKNIDKKNTEKQNYMIARYQYTGKYLGVSNN